MREKLSVIIPTFNEAHNIAACLDSVLWADEVIVVDSFSTDSTAQICKNYGVRIFDHEYVNSASQKNWVLPQVSHTWVLIVDADERVTERLRDEILGLLEGGPGCDGYWIRRRNCFMGREIRHCGWERDKVLRFFDRTKGRYEEKHVHAEIALRGRAGFLGAHLLHDSYRDFSAYLTKLDRYSDWGAQDAAKGGRGRVVEKLLLRPPARFVRMYVFRLGFLDGIQGFMLCSLAAVSVFMKYAKLWKLTRGRH
ncbi:MAG: glycosyltransferase family 2 protein [Candidatus Eisenbacteria bacterium]|nr:glycosyltransferase family 2 protein [Candidatus Eisenbacteria bacterium]